MIEEKIEKIDVRGALRFTLGGVALKLQPSFLNLQRVESGTGKTVLGLFSQSQSGNISVVEIAKIITHCAEPDGDTKLPPKWNHIDVGQSIMDEGLPKYVGVVVTFLGAALSPKPTKRVDGGTSEAGES